MARTKMVGVKAEKWLESLDSSLGSVYIFKVIFTTEQ